MSSFLRRAVSRMLRTRRHLLGPLRSIVNRRDPIRIIDIGGGPEFWTTTPFHGSVLCVNLVRMTDPPDARIRCAVGDARDLGAFADGEFDLAVSNSVLEHVGTWKDQCAAARETLRVARSYYVQTPNFNFPIEPHFIFPGLQYLSLTPRRWVAARWPFGFVKGSAAHRADEAGAIRLLSELEMRRLFPQARLWRERFLGLTKSFVATYVPESDPVPGNDGRLL